MKQSLILLCAATVLALGTPALAQEPNAPAQNEPPLPNSGESAAEQEIPLSALFFMMQQTDEFAAIQNELLELMLAKGEPLQDWSTRGTDMLEVLAQFEALNGSAFRLEEDETSTSIIYLGEPQSLLPDTYIRERIYDGSTTGDIETLLISVAPDLWLELVGGFTMRGTAQCANGIFTMDVLSKNVASQWDNIHLSAVAILQSMLVALDTLDICTVSERNDDGSYTSLVVDGAGTRMAALNEDVSRETIVTRDDALEAIARANSRPDTFAE
ncbi:hypothetical protein [Qipengyuania sp. DGS5-3]|uniref:hypothetical protein n=1 Tax=Qipengyuania sp. DGS5-3 TaxID=3349632 RepID=UPI0036D296B8